MSLVLYFWQERQVISFSETSRLLLETSRSFIGWVQGRLPRIHSDRNVKLNTHLNVLLWVELCLYSRMYLFCVVSDNVTFTNK
jgi:hypothetical protein